MFQDCYINYDSNYNADLYLFKDEKLKVYKYTRSNKMKCKTVSELNGSNPRSYRI